MSVNSAGEINSYYNEVFRSGNLERLLALYEPDAVLEAQPGELVRGRSAIREQLNSLLALKGELHAEINPASSSGIWHYFGRTGSLPVKIRVASP